MTDRKTKQNINKPLIQSGTSNPFTYTSHTLHTSTGLTLTTPRLGLQLSLQYPQNPGLDL